MDDPLPKGRQQPRHCSAALRFRTVAGNIYAMLLGANYFGSDDVQIKHAFRNYFPIFRSVPFSSVGHVLKSSADERAAERDQCSVKYDAAVQLFWLMRSTQFVERLPLPGMLPMQERHLVSYLDGSIAPVLLVHPGTGLPIFRVMIDRLQLLGCSTARTCLLNLARVLFCSFFRFHLGRKWCRIVGLTIGKPFDSDSCLEKLSLSCASCLAAFLFAYTLMIF